MCAEIHVGDTNTEFRITFLDQDGEVIDLTDADITAKRFLFKKPDGTVLTKTASFYTDGTDGIAKYLTLSTDLSDAGKWSLQGKLILTSGVVYSNIIRFDVKENLE